MEFNVKNSFPVEVILSTEEVMKWDFGIEKV